MYIYTYMYTHMCIHIYIYISFFLSPLCAFAFSPRQGLEQRRGEAETLGGAGGAAGRGLRGVLVTHLARERCLYVHTYTHTNMYIYTHAKT